MVNENPIIVALDLNTAADAIVMATSVAPYVGAFKIGLGLLHGPGPGTIDALVQLGKPVFVDAKLHDIPSQVEAAAERLAIHGARWVTAHVGGGFHMLEAAVEGLSRGAAQAEAGILGVSVLTSLDKFDLERIGIQRSPGELVGKMSKVATAAQCEGLICSAHEINTVKQAAPSLKTFVPGIRLGSHSDDQSRTATPSDALARGASFLVIGRPIIAASDPPAAANAIWHSLRSKE